MIYNRSMSDTDALSGFATPTAAEKAFYTAFATCDLQLMDSVWAEEDVICIHPGAAPLLGRKLVMRSWQQILANTEPHYLQVDLLDRTEGRRLAIHLVEEHIMPANGMAATATLVVATNMYRCAASGWHLYGHHASVAGADERERMVETQERHTLQ